MNKLLLVIALIAIPQLALAEDEGRRDGREKHDRRDHRHHDQQHDRHRDNHKHSRDRHERDKQGEAWRGAWFRVPGWEGRADYRGERHHGRRHGDQHREYNDYYDRRDRRHWHHYNGYNKPPRHHGHVIMNTSS